MAFDVAIHTNESIFSAGSELTTTFPPIESRCDLGPGLWVERLDVGLAKALLDFCERTCKGTLSPVRQFSQLYAFVREIPESAPLAEWDRDNRLTNCVGLSRLIHPTSTGFRYAATFRVGDDGLPAQMCKAEISGINIEAHVSPTQKRNWLTEHEAEELKEVLRQFSAQALPKRVGNALWYHEFAFRTWFADVRWTLVCTALEALLNTDTRDNKRQFESRTHGLATELGLEFEKADAQIAYDVRSKLTHGEAFLYGLPKGDLRIYDRMEDLLRASILRAIKDPGFARIFSSGDAVRSHWPL